MKFTTNLELDSGDERELATILGCTVDQLPETLGKHASASVREYVTMYLGQKVLRRGSDIMEHRLFLLITMVLGNRIPDEQDVCRLFQTSATESRALIRAVMSKFQYQLKAAIEASMQAVLEAATQVEGEENFSVTINSQNVVEELNRVLASIDGTLRQITKKRGSVSTFEISPASYARLRERIVPNG